MRALLLFLIFAGSLVAAPTRAEQLEILKKQFPPHVSGKVTGSSDAVSQRYFAKYQSAVDALRLETLATQLLTLRESAHTDIIELERMQTNANKTFSQNTRTAARRNVSWIKERVMPYLARLEQFQRGR
ncbi:MAG: hypothetical protein HZA93_13895 [Verrucomicrobia bacterium]|nr:hypothetical protein [Verrucomicrobiota bacterium]